VLQGLPANSQGPDAHAAASLWYVGNVCVKYDMIWDADGSQDGYVPLVLKGVVVNAAEKAGKQKLSKKQKEVAAELKASGDDELLADPNRQSALPSYYPIPPTPAILAHSIGWLDSSSASPGSLPTVRAASGIEVRNSAVMISMQTIGQKIVTRVGGSGTIPSGTRPVAVSVSVPWETNIPVPILKSRGSFDSVDSNAVDQSFEAILMHLKPLHPHEPQIGSEEDVAIPFFQTAWTSTQLVRALDSPANEQSGQLMSFGETNNLPLDWSGFDDLGLNITPSVTCSRDASMGIRLDPGARKVAEYIAMEAAVRYGGPFEAGRIGTSGADAHWIVRRADGGHPKFYGKAVHVWHASSATADGSRPVVWRVLAPDGSPVPNPTGTKQSSEATGEVVRTIVDALGET